jgi:hypothetical protein
MYIGYTGRVSQLNIHVTPGFARALERFMRLRSISNKSEAVRIAVEEAAQRESRVRRRAEFASWRGAGLQAPLNPSPRFRSEDDLWS